MTPTTTRSEILLVEDLSFAYPAQPALASRWSASIRAGVTLLYGDMGSGKTTMLRVIAGAEPCGGRLTLDGVRLDAAAEAYRRGVFFCDTASRSFDKLSVRECTARLSAGDERFSDARWRELAEGFALVPHLDKAMYMLSTGSKRKVWLAAALASGRPLVLLDEPTGALDAGSIDCLWSAIASSAERGGQAIIVASAERIDSVPLMNTIELPLG